MLNPTSLPENYIEFVFLSVFCQFFNLFVFLSVFNQFFNVFLFLSVFRWIFYCVLIPVRLPSIPRIILLLTSFLVPSLIVGYRPTHSYTVWIASCWEVWSIGVLRFFVVDSSWSLYSMAQFVNWALIFLNSVPCNGFVSASAHITPVGQSTIFLPRYRHYPW